MPEAIKLTKRAVIAAANDFAEAQATIERCKPILLAAMGEHSSGIAGNRIVKVSRTVGRPGVAAYEITADMVGETIPAKRASYDSVRLTVE